MRALFGTHLATGVLTAALIAGPTHVSHAEEDSPAEAERAETPRGWQALGLGRRWPVWQASASVLAAGSDEFGGIDQRGWLLQLAPRISLALPPGRVEGWVSYAPTFRSVHLPDAGPDRRHELQLAHQGSAGLAIGADGGSRLAAEVSRQQSLDPVRSEDAGLAEHIITRAAVEGGAVWPERGSIRLRIAGRDVKYTHDQLKGADHRNITGTVAAQSQILTQVAAGARASLGTTHYRHPPEPDPDDPPWAPYDPLRVATTARTALTLEAQPRPGWTVGLGTGPTWRWDPEHSTHYHFTLDSSFDVSESVRVGLDGGSEIEDSLWRGNRRLRTTHAGLRASGDVMRRLTWGLQMQARWTEYPEPEQPGGERRALRRSDRTWTAGPRLTYHLGDYGRVSASYTHAWRESPNFPDQVWSENRWVLNAFASW